MFSSSDSNFPRPTGDLAGYSLCGLEPVIAQLHCQGFDTAETSQSGESGLNIASDHPNISLPAVISGDILRTA